MASSRLDLDGMEESSKRLVFWFLAKQITITNYKFPLVDLEKLQITNSHCIESSLQITNA